MTIGTTTTLDIIKGALRRINSYQSGETIDTPDEQDCLETFNDLLDSLSLDKQLAFGTNENILSWTAQKNQYTVGNPVCTLLGSAPFTGTVTSGSPTITGVTNMPTNIVAGANAVYTVGSGSILTDTAGLIPENTTVLGIQCNSTDCYDVCQCHRNFIWSRYDNLYSTGRLPDRTPITHYSWFYEIQ